MAQQNSFDIVSEVNMQELDNAINQSVKEVLQRYDLKDSKTTIEFNQKDKIITVQTQNDFTLKSVIDVLQSKFIKRQIPLNAFTYKTMEEAGGQTVRQKITVRAGLSTEEAKEIVKLLKDAKFKTQASILGEQVRVSGKSRDELQAVMSFLKQKDLSFPLQFTNFR